MPTPVNEKLIHLRVIVAIWLTNGNQPVDGANEPRELEPNDWRTAATLTEDLVNEGCLEKRSTTVVGGQRIELHGEHNVVPTAAGVVIALS